MCLEATSWGELALSLPLRIGDACVARLVLAFAPLYHPLPRNAHSRQSLASENPAPDGGVGDTDGWPTPGLQRRGLENFVV